jgi:hypothetical protein
LQRDTGRKSWSLDDSRSVSEEVSMSKQQPPATVGNVIEIVGHRVGEGGRLGEILEILGGPEHVHYRVRWEDGRETLFYPSSDAVVHHRPVPKRTRV